MKQLLLFIMLLSLLGLACGRFQAVDGGNPSGRTPDPAVLLLPTAIPKSSVDASERVTPEGATPPMALTPTPTLVPATATPPAAQITQEPTPCQVRTEWPSYTVQPGDTLFQIAQRSKTSAEALATANCLSSPNHIVVGQRLRVPACLPGVMPTIILDGSNPVVYQPEACFSTPFLPGPGVSTGERWRVAPHLEALTVYDGRGSNTPMALLHKGETVMINEGPYCYTKDVHMGQLAFRRWRVSSLDRPLTGWIDEYDVFTDEISLEPNPLVLKFDVAPLVINSGDPITIAWEVQGANEVQIFSYHSLHRFGSDLVTADFWLPPAGSVVVHAPPSLTSITYGLGLNPDAAGHGASVRIRCTAMFFVDVTDLQACPLAPVRNAEAAYQPFERGFMVWRPDSDTVWVFVQEAPGSHVFRDNWDGEAIIGDEEPPAGLLQPVRGFGNVWLENAWVSQSLGWATATEKAYTMELQETLIGYNVYRHFFSLPDGRLVDAQLGYGSSLSWKYTSRR